jgi:hypothetical protein
MEARIRELEEQLRNLSLGRVKIFRLRPTSKNGPEVNQGNQSENF